MNEQNFDKSNQQEPFDLEKRLTAYYGPPLREQPLSQASWQQVLLRLDSQEQKEAGHKEQFRRPLLRKRPRAVVPPYLQDALAHIAYEARIPYTPSMLRCQLTRSGREPVVRRSWSGRHTIRLLLPVNAVATLSQTERDVLLATGLARSMYARKPAYRFGQLLLVGIVVLAALLLALFWMQHVPLIGLLIAVALCASVTGLWHLHARSIAFHADALIVRWLGRQHVCSGLHALADRSRAPRRRRLGEPSLAERIERVCGTQVDTRENQLTLVG